MLFKQIATFATFALSAISVFAAPAAGVDAVALAKRDQPKSLAQIFTAATEAVTPFTNQLQALTPADIQTTDKIAPIISNITTILNGVVTDVQALAGQPASVILADNANSTDTSADVQARAANDLLGLDAIVQLISALLNVVLAAVGTVLALLSANPTTIALELNLLLSGLTSLLSTIVLTVVTVAGSLLPDLVSLLGGLLSGVLGVLTSLGGGLLGGILGLL